MIKLLRTVYQRPEGEIIMKLNGSYLIHESQPEDFWPALMWLEPPQDGIYYYSLFCPQLSLPQFRLAEPEWWIEVDQERWKELLKLEPAPVQQFLYLPCYRHFSEMPVEPNEINIQTYETILL
jgi:hypothetical protein